MYTLFCRMQGIHWILPLPIMGSLSYKKYTKGDEDTLGIIREAMEL